MTAFIQENLRQNPEGATLLGLDAGANADLHGNCGTSLPPESPRHAHSISIS